MLPIGLRGHNLKKVFNRRIIFEDVSFSLRSQQTLLISGPNGSGKSTLVKMIGGVLTPTGGDIEIDVGGNRTDHMMHSVVGFVSPYLQMYEEFSAYENLYYALGIRGLPSLRPGIRPLLESLQLQGRLDDPVRTFSSGMKQRLKLGLAFYTESRVIFLDEPGSNLDDQAFAWYLENLKQLSPDQLIFIASNQRNEYPENAEVLDLLKFK